MPESIIVAIVTGAISLVGTVLTIIATSQAQTAAMDKKQAVIEERITNLTTAVEKHNGFAQKIPVLEEKISVANHRISGLETKVDKLGDEVK